MNHVAKNIVDTLSDGTIWFNPTATIEELRKVVDDLGKTLVEDYRSLDVIVCHLIKQYNEDPSNLSIEDLKMIITSLMDTVNKDKRQQ